MRFIWGGIPHAIWGRLTLLISASFTSQTVTFHKFIIFKIQIRAVITRKESTLVGTENIINVRSTNEKVKWSSH